MAKRWMNRLWCALDILLVGRMHASETPADLSSVDLAMEDGSSLGLSAGEQNAL